MLVYLTQDCDAVFNCSAKHLYSEVIVVDGGSQDETRRCAKRAGANKVFVSKPGRSKQMNAGVGRATGDVLLFLHADCILPQNWYDEILGRVEHGSGWGCFETIDIRQDVSVHVGLFITAQMFYSLQGSQLGKYGPNLYKKLQTV